jgi:ABC-type dipeptide/oligopeptide/nickel transport system permease component
MQNKTIHTLQIASIAYIWIFVIAVDIWIISLLVVAKRLDDALNASVAIGILAIPLFLIIAIILTYVFVGLQKHRIKDDAAH